MNYLEIHVPKEYENPVRRLTLTSDRGEQIYIAPFNSISTTYSDQYEYVVLRYFPYSIKIKKSKVNHVYITHKLPGISLKRSEIIFYCNERANRSQPFNSTKKLNKRDRHGINFNVANHFRSILV